MNGEKFTEWLGQLLIGGAISWPLFRYLLKNKLDSDKKLKDAVAANSMEQAVTRVEMNNMSSQMGALNMSVRELTTALRHSDLKQAETIAHMTSMQRALEKHGDLITRALPAIQSEIGKLSVYFKGRGGNGK